tara:strand:- start:1870 stop:2076 length:207 start_codon:yes stop_codon:yes gene_type:complete
MLTLRNSSSKYLCGGFACVPGVSKKTAHNVNRDLKTQLGHGVKLGHPYLHDVPNCPQLADTVFCPPLQ